MNVTGKTKIYRRDFNGRPEYSRSISSREFKDGQKGDWIRQYESVQMPKGTDIPDKSTIDVKKGFEAVFKVNDDVRRKLVVIEYSIINEQAQNVAGFESMDNDIPF